MHATHMLGPRAQVYAWDNDVKSMSDLDAMERTSADTGTATRTTLSHTDLGGPSAWTERARGIDGRLAVLLKAVGDAYRGRGRTRLVIALRRLTGSISAVAEAVQTVLEVAKPGALARYVECAVWWLTQLIGSLDEALAGRTPAEQEAAAMAAVDFASLYALGHLDPMRTSTTPGNTESNAAVSVLHEEIMWLASSLREELSRG